MEWSRLAGFEFSEEQKNQMMKDLARIRSMTAEIEKAPPPNTEPLIYMNEKGRLNENYLDPAKMSEDNSRLRQTPKGPYFTSEK